MSATNTPTTTEPTTGPRLDHLWRITDIAAFLSVCENTARTICAEEPDTPRPIVERGSVRLWHGAQWHTWATKRAGLDTPPVTPVGGDPDEWEATFS